LIKKNGALAFGALAFGALTFGALELRAMMPPDGGRADQRFFHCVQPQAPSPETQRKVLS
jgi:hypothetical protein